MVVAAYSPGFLFFLYWRGREGDQTPRSQTVLEGSRRTCFYFLFSRSLGQTNTKRIQRLSRDGFPVLRNPAPHSGRTTAADERSKRNAARRENARAVTQRETRRRPSHLLPRPCGRPPSLSRFANMLSMLWQRPPQHPRRRHEGVEI